MNTYNFELQGIATRKISVRAENANKAFAYLDDMIRNTSVADFEENEIDRMNVAIISGENENGDEIDFDEINAELENSIDDCDGFFFCSNCGKGE